MTDQVEEVLERLGYRVTSMEMDYSCDQPLKCHFNAEGHSPNPCIDEKEIISELESRGFSCLNISCRKDIDTFETWTVGSRLPEIIQGRTHYTLSVSILPKTMQVINGLPHVMPVADDSFNLSGAL